MTDKMEFPKTMKEFIDSFSFKDSEEIYTNGAELIPVFRVEQGLEHYAKEIRAKALDDFVKMAYEELLYSDGLSEIDIDYIAEQLKVVE